MHILCFSHSLAPERQIFNLIFFYPLNFSRSPWPRSQDLEPLISLPFVINILKKNNLVKWGSCVGKKPFFYVLDNLTAKDIDNPEDFLFCESMYKKKK